MIKRVINVARLLAKGLLCNDAATVATNRYQSPRILISVVLVWRVHLLDYVLVEVRWFVELAEQGRPQLLHYSLGLSV